MSRFNLGQHVAEVGLNGMSIASIGEFSKDGSKLTLLRVNTSGKIEKSWREYDAETGLSIRTEYKGQTLAQTQIIELPSALGSIAADFMEFEARSIAGLKTAADSAKRAALEAYRAAAASLGTGFGVGEKKISGKLGEHRATCTVRVTQIAAGLYGAAVKFFDADAEESYANPGWREGKHFASDSEVVVAIGKCIKAISLPATWQIEKAEQTQQTQQTEQAVQAVPDVQKLPAASARLTKK